MPVFNAYRKPDLSVTKKELLQFYEDNKKLYLTEESRKIEWCGRLLDTKGSQT